MLYHDVADSVARLIVETCDGKLLNAVLYDGVGEDRSLHGVRRYRSVEVVADSRQRGRNSTV